MVFCTWGEVSLCRKTISYYQHQLIPTNGMQRKRRTGVPLAKDQASLIPSIFFLCQGLSLVSTTIHVVKRVVRNRSTHQMRRNSRDTHTQIDIDGEKIIVLIFMMISHVYYLLGSHSLFLSITSPNTIGVYILVERSYFGMSLSLVPLLK
jgi:hypothetical protein